MALQPIHVFNIHTWQWRRPGSPHVAGTINMCQAKKVCLWRGVVWPCRTLEAVSGDLRTGAVAIYGVKWLEIQRKRV